MQATIENIKDIIAEAETLGDGNHLKIDTPLIEQGMDSLDIVNVFLLIQEKFDIEIPDDDYIQLETIDKIVEYINTK